MINLWQLFLLSFLGSVVGLIGGILLLFSKKWRRTLEENSIPFAAGVLLTITLVGLFPEAVELIGESTYTIVLITFITAYTFERLFFGIHHHEHKEHEHKHKSAVIFVIVGDTIHNLIDGIAIGASFIVAPGLGLITAISTFLHEVPHEIGDFGILLHAGWKNKQIIIVNVISAAVTVVGAFSVIRFSQNQNLIGMLLAVSGGIFLYLGASDFLPRISQEKAGNLKTLLPLLIGAAIMLIILSAIPHTG